MDCYLRRLKQELVRAEQELGGQGGLLHPDLGTWPRPRVPCTREARGEDDNW